jgi:glycosyltransferase involved in cell wall biosynthesis
MRISVIIPAKNEERNLQMLLTDLKRQSTKPTEIIVADAQSTDSTRRVARLNRCKVVQGGHPATGRNRGARAAKGELLLFLDADVRILDVNFLRDSVEQLTRRRLDMAIVSNKPRWHGTETRCQRTWLRLMHAVMNGFIRAVSRTPFAVGIGTCMFFRRDTFKTIGGFNERILWGEDTESVGRVLGKRKRFGMLGTSVYASTRRVLDQGVVRFYVNVILLQGYRIIFGEIRTWKTYGKLTGRKHHFAFKTINNE